MRGLEAFVTSDASQLRPVLSREAVGAAYLLGDLDEPYFAQCRWFGASYEGRPVSVLAVFEGLSEPCLLSHGAPDGVSAILQKFGPALPGECPAKIPLEHQAAVASFYRIAAAERHWIMGLASKELQPAVEPEGVRRLGEADLAAMEALYEGLPGHFFEPGQLAVSPFFGKFVAGRLVSIAGCHVFSPAEGVVVLGNIVTHPESRSQGHARACTSRLIRHSRERGCRTVALQVAETNAPAISCYRRLGFVFDSVVLQARCSV